MPQFPKPVQGRRPPAPGVTCPPVQGHMRPHPNITKSSFSCKAGLVALQPVHLSVTFRAAIGKTVLPEHIAGVLGGWKVPVLCWLPQAAWAGPSPASHLAPASHLPPPPVPPLQGGKSYTIDALGYTFANAKDAPIRFPALFMENTEVRA